MTEMTNEELKALVAGLAVSQAETDKAIKALNASQAETDKAIKALSAAQAKTDEQLAKTDAQLAKTDAQLAETRALVAETAQTLKRTTKLVGNMGHNLGNRTEEFFFNSLAEHQTLAGIQYDSIDKNVSRRVGKLADEFDIVLINGKDVAIIEVKRKAHEADLIKLLTKKYENFKALFPAYKDYQYHLALATFSIYDEFKDKALEQGVIVLQQKGRLIETFVSAA